MVGCPSASNPRRNMLLAALPRREQDQLFSFLEPVALEFGKVLYEPGERIRHVYFPTSGMISLLLVLNDGAVAEVARVGNEGVLGLPVFLQVPTSQTRAFVQMAGAAFRIKAEVFRREALEHEALFSLVLRYTEARLNHVSQLTACNTWHSIEQRLCRWLLITQDRLQTDQFMVTQQHLARMLGVHRQGVTQAAGSLQRAGVIRYSRGRLTMLDRQGVEAASCECYQAITSQFERLFA
jgi:CRP-like cAMP-binding protein